MLCLLESHLDYFQNSFVICGVLRSIKINKHLYGFLEMTPRLPSTSCWSVQTNFIFYIFLTITALRSGSFHYHDYEFALSTIPTFAALLLLVVHLTKFLNYYYNNHSHPIFLFGRKLLSQLADKLIQLLRN